MDIPLISKFACGYVQGVKSVDPNIEVFQNMTGTTAAAWNDPTKGGELAKSQFDQGADVVFAAAGATSLGVYQAAKDSGKLAIGVDSNQNHLHPGTMLSSMMKRVDVAVHGAVTGWKGGVSELGLKEQGVDAAFDEYNKPLVTDEMRAKVEAAKADIIAGKIKVHDYVADNACPTS
jgi:basic membrane protein A